MKVQLRPTTELSEDPANLRDHPARSIEAIKASLRRFGFQKPVVVDSKGVVRAGNGTLRAARELGIEKVPTVVSDLDGSDLTAYAIADNRSAEFGEWRAEDLVATLRGMSDEDRELVGFTAEDIAAIDNAEQKEIEDAGADPEPETPVSRLGDLWILGEHRLLCGDSTKPEAMARLMAGETAALLATDPPYLVDYDGTNHPKEHHIKAGRTGTSITGGKHWDAYQDPESSVEFFADFLRVALAHCIDRVPIYQWHATRRQALVEQAWEANDLLVHQTIVWAKPRGVLTRSHFLWAHEPAFYGWRRGMQPEKDRRPPPSERTVWELGSESDGIHPTQKPLAVFLGPIEWHTKPGEVVLEPFSGSGTQLVAAEKLARRCRAMELSPPFVDVAVRRWEKTTGKQATLDGDGRTFAEVATERLGTAGRAETV